MSWKPALVANLFDASAELMRQYQQIATLDVDPDLPLQLATAMFACFTGKREYHRKDQHAKCRGLEYRELDDGEDKVRCNVLLSVRSTC